MSTPIIEKDEVITQLILSKSKFKSVEEAVQYAKENFFYWGNGISETETDYLVEIVSGGDMFEDENPDMVDWAEGVKVLKRKIEIEDGSSEQPISLSLRNAGTMKFSEGIPSIIELAKVVKGEHSKYGKVEITKDDLRSMVKNFKENVTGVDVSIDFDHSQSEACGWVKDLFLSHDEMTLYGIVKWTPSGALALSDRKFRYFSPEFSLSYVHPHTGVNHGPTLLGGGLVNRPFLKMAPIVEMSNKTEDLIMSEKTILLTEHEEKVSIIAKELADVKTLSETLKDENKKLSEKILAIEEEKKVDAKKAEFTKLLSENKACEAQRDAFMKGDLNAFVQLAQNMNSGKGNGGTVEETQLSDEEKRLAKELNVDEKDVIRFNK